MVKKPILIIATLLLMTACVAEEQTKETPLSVESQTTTEKVEQTNEAAEEPIEEEPLNLAPLKGKVWSNLDESYFVRFTELSEDRMEIRLMQAAETTEVKEYHFIAHVDQHDTDSWSGTLTSETAQAVFSSKNTDLDINLNDDFYKLSIGDLETLELQESSLSLNEWEEKKKTLKELSDSEVINLIQNIETQSAERFGTAFTETVEGYTFNEDFQSILSSLEHFYTDSYQSGTLRSIYDNPIYMLETLYAFPLADTSVLNYQVIRSPEKLTVYIESEFYGYSEYTHYSVIAENKEWKISSRSRIVTPEMAKYGVLAVSGEDADPDAYAKLIRTPDFNELVQMVQTDERYYVSTHLDYDDIQIDVWLYQVDPLTGMVYSYDRVIDRAVEMGSLFDEE
ncbi:hypothetical protein [Planococcus shenhongbingii]|uniref:PepSY domain-containing protein n=1 Tax=Planococcus shenhongbingii TaxID=3058398 RepID=A0ABT8N9W1_9BACL|nr:hypothetical protein [Planococcus sp. N017]MDN7244675.1 hypothetical protein [Planococcus sp. N017]